METETMTYSPLLPPEILEMILDPLDESSLRAMRMTSKQIQKVVDQPKYLQKIQVRIVVYQDLLQLLNSAKLEFTPWCNFYLGSMYFMSSRPFINSFTTQFGGGIKTCALYSFSTFGEATDLFSKLMSLESLKIWRIEDWGNADRYHGEVKTWLAAQAEPERGNKELMKKAEDNLIGLKHLNIRCIDVLDPNYKDPYSFESLLEKCPNLVTLRLPICIRGKTFRKHFLDPLVNYLKQNHSRRQAQLGASKKVEPLKIDFGNFFSLGYEETRGYSPYFIQNDVFLKIVKYAARSNVSLISVPYYLLPKWDAVALILLRDRNLRQIVKMSQVVSSVLIYPDLIPNNWQDIYYLPDNAIVEHYGHA